MTNPAHRLDSKQQDDDVQPSRPELVPVQLQALRRWEQEPTLRVPRCPYTGHPLSMPTVRPLNSLSGLLSTRLKKHLAVLATLFLAMRSHQSLILKSVTAAGWSRSTRNPAHRRNFDSHMGLILLW